MFGFLKKRRRRRARARPFPAGWRDIIARNVAYSKFLDSEEREVLESHILVFLDEKSFEGCGGFEITDEVRVTIAAQACLLLLRREADYYPSLKLILVYPTAYRVATETYHADGTVAEDRDVRLGESWHRGSVVLSWQDVIGGARDPRDGRNLVLHEFSHQLDAESGGHNGAPRLENRARYGPWARALGEAYDELVADVERGRRTTLDSYGATNPAEFFAVATEEFFEQPLQLERTFPEVYEQLRIFFGQDPADRLRRQLRAE